METEKAIGQKAILRQKEIGVISTEGNTLSELGQPIAENDAARLKELESLATKTEVELVVTETEQAIQNINDAVDDIILKNVQQEAEIIAARLKNINQDLRLDSVENINATQELEIDNNYNKNVQQDVRLEVLETAAVAQTSDYSIYSAGGLLTPTPSVFKPSSIDRDFIIYTSPKNVATNLVSAIGFNTGELYVYLKQSCSTEHEFYIVSNEITDTKVNVIVELWKRDNQEDPSGDTLIDSSNISCDFSTNTQVAGSNSLYGDIIAASSPTDPTGYYLKVYTEEDGTGDNTVSVSLSRIVSKITTIDGGETGIIYDNDVIATNDAGGANVAESINIVNGKADANTIELTTKVEKEVYAPNPQFKSSIKHNEGAVEILGDFNNGEARTKVIVDSNGARVTQELGEPGMPTTIDGIVIKKYADEQNSNQYTTITNETDAKLDLKANYVVPNGTTALETQNGDSIIYMTGAGTMTYGSSSYTGGFLLQNPSGNVRMASNQSSIVGPGVFIGGNSPDRNYKTAMGEDGLYIKQDKGVGEYIHIEDYIDTGLENKLDKEVEYTTNDLNVEHIYSMNGNSSDGIKITSSNGFGVEIVYNFSPSKLRNVMRLRYTNDNWVSTQPEPFDTIDPAEIMNRTMGDNRYTQLSTFRKLAMKLGLQEKEIEEILGGE